jgi:sRNA-binding protein
MIFHRYHTLMNICWRNLAPTYPPEPRRQLVLLAVIRKRFPATFFIHKPKPLKIGMHTDLLALGVLDEKGVRAFLGAYCKLGRYLAALVPGAQRVDLDGNPTGEVTPEEADSGVATLICGSISS